MINTKQIIAREEKIYSEKIDENCDGLLLLYFSDLYYGQLIDNDFLEKLVDKINAFNPDVVVFGGDLIADYSDKGITTNEKQILLSFLSNIQAKYGKYAILGDKDVDSDFAKSNIAQLLIDSNFNILDNASAKIYADRNSYINIVGINNALNGNPDIASAFNEVDSQHYTLAFSHCPDIFEQLRIPDYDYGIAGHSMSGQIYFPIINYLYRQQGAEKYFRGKNNLNGKILDISNGVGRNKINARLFADSEIVLYTFYSLKTDKEA